MPYQFKTANVRYSIVDEKNTVSNSIQKNYQEMFQVKQTIGSADTLIKLLSFDHSGIASNKFRKGELIVIRNTGEAGMEVMFLLKAWTAGTPDVATSTVERIIFYIPPGEIMILPNSRMLHYSAISSAGNGATLDNVVPTAAGYTDSTANVEGSHNDSVTTLSIEDADADSNGKIEDCFFIGDYIRVNNEVMRITAVPTDDSGDLTVERAQFGSVAASHSDSDAVSWYYLNNLHDWDKEAIISTTTDGKFEATNFFGYGRTYTAGGTDVALNGLVPGSVAIKFYNPGYQEIGISGITTNTESGLVGGTTYQFNIAVDGGSATNIPFTVDTQNQKFGGAGGVIQQIQTKFNSLYYDASSNLFQRRVYVGVINGDIRFTSGQSLTTSAVALTDSTGGDTDWWGVGRIPAVGSIADATIAKLPDDTYLDKDGILRKNNNIFLLDQGNGQLLRRNGGTGTINYETGKISMRGVPPRASFVISANYSSALGGGPRNGSSVTGTNQIDSINARCTNSKAETYIEILVYG